MQRLSKTTIDRLLIAGSLIAIFIVFPGATWFWQTHKGLTAKVREEEISAATGGTTTALPPPSPCDSTAPMMPDDAPPPPVAAGTKATDFASTTVDGKSFVFDSQSSHIKVVDFWATWCGPCRMSIPGLIDIKNRLKNSGVQMVGVSVDTDSASMVKPFAKQMGMNYTVLVDPTKNQLAASTYNATSLPSLYIIDGKGIIRWSFSGYWPDEEPYVWHVISEIQAGKTVD